MVSYHLSNPLQFGDHKKMLEIQSGSPFTEDTSRLASLYATLIVQYRHFQSDHTILTRKGFPAKYFEQDGSTTLSTLRSVRRLVQAFSGRKHCLHVQIPSAALHDAQIKSFDEVTTHHQDPSFDLTTESFIKSEFTHTALEARFAHITGYRSRPVLRDVIWRLFKAGDAKQAVLHYPKQYANVDWTLSATVPVCWATLRLLPPPSVAETSTRKGMACPIQSISLEESIEDNNSGTESNFTLRPSAQEENKLKSILKHLEKIGCLWTCAGFDQSTILRTSDSTIRPAFLVQGLFPKFVLQKCNLYRKKSYLNSLSDDSVPQEESEAAMAEGLFEECSVYVIREPFGPGLDPGAAFYPMFGLRAGAGGGGF